MLNFNKIADVWDEYTYPWRPGKDFLSYIQPYIIQSKNPLILGSTKEFREKFIGKKCTICDLSLKMIDKNSVENSNEKVLNKDWFDLKGNNYDLILGDLVTLMFDYEKQNNLLGILQNNLSEEGVLILRTVLSNKGGIEDSKLVKKYISIYGGRTLWNYLSFEFVLGKGYHSEQIYKILKKVDNKIAREFKNNFQKIVPYDYQDFYLSQIEGNYSIYSPDKRFENLKERYILIKKKDIYFMKN